MEQSFICPDEQATQSLAARLARVAKAPLIIFLSGELGVGKTAFARGFIQSLGYRGKVTSPTYTLVNAYPFDGFEVFHFDFYRFSDVLEFEHIGGRDYFHPRSICLIEWPERVAELQLTADITANITADITCENGRLIRVDAAENYLNLINYL